ncbi:MAG TPA: S8 family serine peptidase [Terriglobales bacterium]|jgi:subtilisin family serine protease|nr:S8 family serine peptidase [Terriglobales bacterium]
MLKPKPGTWFLLLCVFCCQTGVAQISTKKKVASQSDLPRFTYPMSMPASELLQADAATFNGFAEKVGADLDTLLSDYDISDKATLRALLAIKADLQQLAGDYEGALKTVHDLRAVQDKPTAKLTARLRSEAELEAALRTKSTSGPEYEQAFASSYKEAVSKLPWDVVQDWAKAAWAQSKTSSRAGLIGMAKTELDPAVEKSKALSNDEAWELVDARTMLQFGIPEKEVVTQVLGEYVIAHKNMKPDVWEAREVTLTPADKLTPVLVGIWDSGVDVGIFGGQVFNDPHPTESGNHGWAFDSKGNPATGWLFPLTQEQQAQYPIFREEIKARLDLENGVDSPAAQAFKNRMSTLTPDQMHERAELRKVLGFYLHGTHVAGIVARGNPAVRLVVARFDDQLPDLPFQPTQEWAHRMAAAFGKLSDYFRTRGVRVVNMSWGDDPREIEQWLAKTGGPTDPAERKKRAGEIFAIWHDAVENAIKHAPKTLFVCAAGNSDSDASFLRDVPAGLRLPNLIAVGAVNQAGDETSFTSYGPTVVVDANGYQVDSFVPGGTRAKLSGTSMASPNVANLAAKLFALDPSLTPEKVIDLIRRGADTSEDGRRHLINPEKSVELLRGGKARTAAAH